MTENKLANVYKEPIEVITSCFTFYPKKRCLELEGTLHQLRKKEFEVLALLCKKYPNPVHHSEFLDEVWGGGYVTSHSIAQVIRSLRKLLKKNGKNIILTISKLGYRLGIEPQYEEENDVKIIGFSEENNDVVPDEDYFVPSEDRHPSTPPPPHYPPGGRVREWACRLLILLLLIPASYGVYCSLKPKTPLVYQPQDKEVIMVIPRSEVKNVEVKDDYVILYGDVTKTAMLSTNVKSELTKCYTGSNIFNIH